MVNIKIGKLEPYSQGGRIDYNLVNDTLIGTWYYGGEFIQAHNLNHVCPDEINKPILVSLHSTKESRLPILTQKDLKNILIQIS